MKITARMIGFEPAEPGYCYPIFEYKRNGLLQTYKRQKQIEQSPFLQDKDWTLEVNHWEVYEITERKKKIPGWLIGVLLLFTLGVAKTIFLVVAYYFIMPIINVIKIILARLNLQKYHKCEGTIVWYKEEYHGGEDGDSYCYYPIIEYQYKGNVYQHICRSTQEPTYLQNLVNIYIDDSRQKIMDEYFIKRNIFSELVACFWLFPFLFYTLLLVLQFVQLDALIPVRDFMVSLMAKIVTILENPLYGKIIMSGFSCVLAVPVVLYLDYEILKIKYLQKTQKPIRAIFMHHTDFGNSRTNTYQYIYQGKLKLYQQKATFSQPEIELYIDEKNQKAYCPDNLFSLIFFSLIISSFFIFWNTMLWIM